MRKPAASGWAGFSSQLYACGATAAGTRASAVSPSASQASPQAALFAWSAGGRSSAHSEKGRPILKGETRAPEFLADINANGRIPTLQIGDRFLPESNAACFYLAEGSALIPDDRFDRADMLRWMCFDQQATVALRLCH